MRILVLSDLHVDYPANMSWVLNLSKTDYQGDALILAGDVSDKINLLKETFVSLLTRFKYLFFVPGNHEAWIRQNEFANSIEKLNYVSQLANLLGIITVPKQIENVWIIPILSWYVQPKEGSDSLYVPKKNERKNLKIGDYRYIKWGLKEQLSIADSFLDRNDLICSKSYDAPIISFSHFLPRKELLSNQAGQPGENSRVPGLNFSMVAGSKRLERQIRLLGSKIHVYGHQHRNRDKTIEGVRYISNCLGYPKEREIGQINEFNGLKLIWDSNTTSNK
jgi:predicted phosphodiesterase